MYRNTLFSKVFTMSRLMSDSPPKLQDQVNLRNWRTAPFNQWAFSNVRNLLPTAVILSNNNKKSFEQSFENLSSIKVTTSEKNVQSLEEFLNSSYTDCMIVVKNGKLVWSWYNSYSSQKTPHIIFSISKSLTSLLALSLAEENIIELDIPILRYVPEVEGGAYEDATVRNLLDMNVSSTFEENYLANSGIFHEYRNATGWNEVLTENRQGLWDFLPSIPKGESEHGELIHYCSPHTDMLGWVIEKVAGAKYGDLLAKRILQPCGLSSDAYVTLDFFGASRAAGGINICALDLAKIGEMIRCGGQSNGNVVLQEGTVADICNYDNGVSWKNRFHWADKLFPEGRYRSNWYQTQSPDKEVFGSGIHGQWLWINPAKQITIVRMGSHPLPLTISDKDHVVDTFRQITHCIS